MRVDGLLRAVFILYCVEAGTLFCLVPWSPGWDRTVIQIPLALLRNAMLDPLLRSAVSGFGIVHLVWGAHDLDAWIASRRPAA